MERGGSSYSQLERSEAEAEAVERRLKREADEYMPMASLMRIMRRVLPDHAKVADDAKEAIQECVSEFISFVTREANHSCHREYRRTVTPNDVVSAMSDLGFHDYVEPLTLFINKHRAAQDYYPPPRAAILPPQTTTTTVAAYVPSPPPPPYMEMRDYFMGYPYPAAAGDQQGQDFDPFN